MKVAIGIPTYNRGQILLETISQALELKPPPDEIVVVDQSDWYPEGVKERLEELGRKGAIRYFHQSQANLPAARNRILAEARSEVVVFIDDDVELVPGFVSAHKQNYADDMVWAVAGRITEDREKPCQNIERRWPKVLDYLYCDLSSTTRNEDFGTFRGCNHSILRTHAFRLGGYDEEYTGVALREEGDMALRIIASGGRIVFDPTASLHHLRSPTGGCRINTWGDKSAAACSLRFGIKHKNLLGWHWWKEVLNAYRLGVVNRRTLRNPWVALERHAWFIKMFLSLYRLQGMISKH